MPGIELKQNSILFIVLPQIVILFIISVHSNTGEKWISCLNRFKIKGLVALCHLVWYLLFLTIIQTVRSYILSSFIDCRGLSSRIFIASSLTKRRTSMGCRAENRTRACLAADALPTELRRTPGLSLLFTKSTILDATLWRYFAVEFLTLNYSKSQN